MKGLNTLGMKMLNVFDHFCPSEVCLCCDMRLRVEPEGDAAGRRPPVQREHQNQN